MESKRSQEQAGELESDPRLYKINSVIGEVTSKNLPIPGATITVVATEEEHAVAKNGTYVLELDPERLGSNTHELLFSAPGYKDQRHTVTIPQDKRIRLDVELEPKSR